MRHWLLIIFVLFTVQLKGQNLYINLPYNDDASVLYTTDGYLLTGIHEGDSILFDFNNAKDCRIYYYLLGYVDTHLLPLVPKNGKNVYKLNSEIGDTIITLYFIVNNHSIPDNKRLTPYNLPQLHKNEIATQNDVFFIENKLGYTLLKSNKIVIFKITVELSK